MAASDYQIYVFSSTDPHGIKHSKNLEPIFFKISVSADGNDNGLTISESSGKFHFNSKILAGISAAIATGQAVEYDQFNTALALYIPLTQKGAANGVATLDGSGKIPSSQLTVDIVEYKGTWNATTNSPSLADGVGNQGDFYIVSVAGSQDLGSGSITYAVGDWVFYNGTIWEKVQNSVTVTSVNGFTGAVVLTTTNIAEGTNLYFTDTRARTAAVADSITDGVTNIAPSQNAVYDALALKQDISDRYRAYTNTQGGTVTVRQVAYQDPASAGDAKLVRADTSDLNEGTEFLMVKDASIADTVSGNYYLPRKGTTVGGFTGLTRNSPIYLSRVTAGSYIQSLSGFVTGESIVELGIVISATEIIWDPRYLGKFS